MQREDDTSRRASRVAVPLDPHLDREIGAISCMKDLIAEERLVNGRSDVLYSGRTAGQSQESEQQNPDWRHSSPGFRRIPAQRMDTVESGGYLTPEFSTKPAT
jgi:hypothetical protein